MQAETTHMSDAKAFIGWLDQQPSVAQNRKIGTQGYCMGGPIAVSHGRWRPSLLPQRH
jgi:dienelactone hydrolase